jgi:hypothetical protein
MNIQTAALSHEFEHAAHERHPMIVSRSPKQASQKPQDRPEKQK